MPTNNIANNYVNLLGSYIPFVSGNWYKSGGPLYYGATLTPGTIATSGLRFLPFFVSAPSATFTDIAICMSSASAQNVNMGIYGSNTNNTRPIGNPLPNSTSGSISTNAIGPRPFTFPSPITLTQGIYWLGITTSGTTSMICTSGITAGSESRASFGLTTIQAFDDNLIAGWIQTFTYGTTLPTVGTLSALASGLQVLLAWLKAQ